VYLDQPVGTGFSYGNSYVDRLDLGAKEFVKFMEAFLTMYPEYQKKNGRKFFMTGESYAGKYLP
jgi:carboxypeptidase C (cathepsin A)